MSSPTHSQDRSKPTGGPAFPGESLNRHNIMTKYTGMTLRDYYAGQVVGCIMMDYPDSEPEVVAMRSYAIADAMLHERAQR